MGEGLTPARGFVARAVTVEGEARRYQVFVPAKWTARRRWPVILSLHGSGERGDDGEAQLAVGLGATLRKRVGGFPAVVVLPQAPEGAAWAGHPARVAMAALDETVREFRGDPARVYLTGISLGGYGTWQLAADHPARFAALVPVCGGILPPRPDSPLRVVPPAGGEGDPYAAVAERVRDVPAWVFHGAADARVPVEESRRMVEALRRAGADVRYTEYDGVGHNAWDAAYGEMDLWNWMLGQKRK